MFLLLFSVLLIFPLDVYFGNFAQLFYYLISDTNSYKDYDFSYDQCFTNASYILKVVFYYHYISQ
jgi:hypothetical protein